MNAFSFGPIQLKNTINFANAEYRNFIVREVFDGDQPKGEYHIGIRCGMKPAEAMARFRAKIADSKIGMVDPSGELNLDYPIFIKTDSDMVKNCINEIFELIDEEIGGKL